MLHLCVCNTFCPLGLAVGKRGMGMRIRFSGGPWRTCGEDVGELKSTDTEARLHLYSLF